MRGKPGPQADLLSLMSPEKFVPQGHPLRAIKPFVDAALQQLSPLLDEMYAEIVRPSLPLERLRKAKLLQAFDTIPSNSTRRISRRKPPEPTRAVTTGSL